MKDDTPEKNSQIKKMAMIYNRASNVCVWLGRQRDDSGRAIEFIHKLLRLEDFDPLTEDPGTTDDWAAFHKLMQRSWFSRRWIVQEISLARNAMLFCGSHSVAWQDFASAVSLFAARYRDLPRLFRRSADFYNDPNYLGEVEALGAKSLVDITTNLFRKSKEGFVLERLLSLEALVSTLTLFEVSSPHDIIYAVLWLAHDAEPDSKDYAAMSLEPNVRTPLGSPELDYTGSSDEDGSVPSITIEPEQSRFVRSPSPFNEEYRDNEPRRQSASNVHGDFLKPFKPPRKPKRSPTARSASDRSLSMAEIQSGIAPPKSIMVDYDSDPFDVYRQFLEYAIGRSRSLDIICHPWAPEVGPSGPKLPSWIPQLSGAPFEWDPWSNAYVRVRADSLVGIPGRGSKNYNASGKTKLYPERNFIQERTLIVSGFSLDTIQTTQGKARDGVIPSEWKDLVEWSGPPEPVPDRFWRTLVADRSMDGQHHPPAYFPLACRWVFEQKSRRADININKLLTHGKCPSIVTEFLRRVQAVCFGRRLAQTAGMRRSPRLLALVPDNARRGDIVCILHGCSVPVVIRRLPQKRSGSRSNSSQRSTKSSKKASSASMQSVALAPQISLTTEESQAESESATRRKSTQPSESLIIPSQRLDTSFSSTGIRKALEEAETKPEQPPPPISRESRRNRYEFIGECYVHGMMAGEAFKHQRDFRISQRSYHLI